MPMFEGSIFFLNCLAFLVKSKGQSSSDKGDFYRNYMLEEVCKVNGVDSSGLSEMWAKEREKEGERISNKKLRTLLKVNHKKVPDI